MQFFFLFSSILTRYTRYMSRSTARYVRFFDSPEPPCGLQAQPFSSYGNIIAQSTSLTVTLFRLADIDK